MSIRSIRLVALALLAGLHAAPSSAQTATPDANTSFSADLVVGGIESADPRTAWLGLDIHLDPGWHTYWRSSGDAGAPPEFNWSGSQNVADPAVEWPAPRRFSEGGIDTFGYAEHVILPIKLRLEDASSPAHVSLDAVLYVCSTICTRNDLHFAADIRPGLVRADRLKLINEWRERVPRASSSTITLRSLRLERQPEPRLILEVLARPPLGETDVFVDGDPAVVGGRPQIAQAADGASLVTLPLEGVDRQHPQQPLRVTLVDGSRSLEAVSPQQASADSVPPGPAQQDRIDAGANTMLSMVLLSLLGGFILNFMPCVFPVLSLKLVALTQHASEDVRAIRMRFVASAAGIVASFVALAAILSLLKSAGTEVGWGMQFQQPAFLITMTAILTVFGASLFDIFAIRLPWWLVRALGRVDSGPSIVSHFVNGVVMTLLATPCSAPFVGTAVAFALSQNAMQIFVVFVALGLGMASPYLLVAGVPRLARLFPRPGAWMLVLRRVAALAMVGTAIWLLKVLNDVSGPLYAISVAAALVAFVLVLVLPRRRRWRAGWALAAVVPIGLLVVAENGVPSWTTQAESPAVSWQPLAPERIEAMVRAGQTIFVDIGASWCVTCKVNETLVIDSAAVRQRLVSDVIPVKGDWTTPNETIAAYLKSFGRYGIPFNAVFGPGAPGGIVLPELLTRKTVLDAFEAASGHTPQH